jgi:hypothetical protein
MYSLSLQLHSADEQSAKPRQSGIKPSGFKENEYIIAVVIDLGVHFRKHPQWNVGESTERPVLILGTMICHVKAHRLS